MRPQMTIIQLPMLSDNYSYVLVCEVSGETAVVDPAQHRPVIDALDAHDLSLGSILCTHHHFDHIGGNAELVSRYQPVVVGHRSDHSRIATMTTPVDHNDRVTVGDLTATVLFTPGHTSGHVAYYFPAQRRLFCGDTLFAGGCGRLFEGTAEQMYQALNASFANLPAETEVYCGHEYTESNLRFALTLEPDNDALRRRVEWVRERRKLALPTVPSTIADELATNPFMRTRSPELLANLQAQVPELDASDPIAVFGATRQLKDQF